jgi:hypothetical protein
MTSVLPSLSDLHMAVLLSKMASLGKQVVKTPLQFSFLLNRDLLPSSKSRCMWHILQHIYLYKLKITCFLSAQDSNFPFVH